MAKAITTHFRFDLRPIDSKTGLINAVIEAPRGSRYKHKFDPELAEFRLDKALPAGAVFPFDFGFIPGTKADDGDPLDIMVLLDEPSGIGSIVPVRLIGVIEAEQTEQSGKTSRNDRLLGVLETRHNPPPFRSIDEVSPQLLDEIEHFFKSFNEAEGRIFRVLDRGDANRARELLEANLSDIESSASESAPHRRARRVPR